MCQALELPQASAQLENHWETIDCIGWKRQKRCENHWFPFVFRRRGAPPPTKTTCRSSNSSGAIMRRWNRAGTGAVSTRESVCDVAPRDDIGGCTPPVQHHVVHSWPAAAQKEIRDRTSNFAFRISKRILAQFQIGRAHV